MFRNQADQRAERKNPEGERSLAERKSRGEQEATRVEAPLSFPALTLGVIVATLELQRGIAIPILPKENGSSR